MPDHVSGVVLDHRTELRADLVIDASGRRSLLPGWLDDLGTAPMAEESEDSGFTNYSRFFQAPDGADVPSFHGLMTTHFDCFSILAIRSDARTWSLTVHTSSRDRALKALHAGTNWTRLIKASPLHAELATGGEPITGVLPASGIVNRIRHLVIDGVPIATGVLAIGDSWACTNPAGGRGITLGLMHAAITAEAVREHLGNPMALALAHYRKTNERLLPWYRDVVRGDRVRIAQVNAVIEGRDASGTPLDPYTAIMRNFALAAQRDADLYRAFLEMRTLLTPPDELLARPGMIDRINEVAAGRQPLPPPGPSRTEVLALLS
jgi:2-polyprenyl-6-methoxyphenol hydroxylase-like FAD-dependent oxidoreductase